MTYDAYSRSFFSWLHHSPSSAKGKRAHWAGIFLSRFPFLCERRPGCGGEMHRWSCPLSGAEIYFSTLGLLMVSGSVSGAILLPGAEMCYSTLAS